MDSSIWPTSLSKDGNTLFIGQWNTSGKYNIGMLNMGGDRTAKLLLQEEYNEWNPQISPDGRWLAYVSDESNRNEVYVLPFPDINICEKQKVTTDGGSNPIWSPGSRELFYGSPDGGLMVVSVDTDPSLKLEKPQRPIDPRPYLAGDIDPENGKRFLVIKKVEETEEDSAQGRPRKIIVVTNWFEELKKQVSAD